MKRILSFFLTFILSCCLTLSACLTDNTPQSSIQTADHTIEKNMSFDDFTNALFRETLLDDTLSLHFLLKHPKQYGIEQYPVSLGDVSLSSIQNSTTHLQAVADKLSLYHYDSLSASQKLTYDVLKDSLELSLEKNKTPLFSEPLNPLHGAPSQLPVLFAEYRFLNSRDIDDYLSLLSQFKTLFSSIYTFEKEKSKNGMFMSDFAVNDVIKQCQNMLQDTEHHFLKTTFEKKIDAVKHLSDTQRQIYKEKNQQLLDTIVFPSYQSLIKNITSLLGTGKNDAGLCHFKGGKSYYRLLVREATGSNRSIAELEKKTELQRLSDLQQVQSLLQKHPELSSIKHEIDVPQTSPQSMLEDLKEKMTDAFPASSVTNFSVKYVEPSLEETLSPAFYLTAPLDDPQENVIYINAGSQYSGLQLYTTLAHEGFPGHMYQTTFTQQTKLPAIRSLLSYSGYTEGWATYVEMLAYQYADIDSNITALLQKHQSALLSLYATCDMKIHYNGWSLSDTASFLSTFGITDSETISEIYHLIIETPANYLSYYIGYLEFLDLKKNYQQKKGIHFSEKIFHQKILSIGSAPFSVLKKYCYDDSF